MKLKEIAYARSGDKGNSVNIGVLAYKSKGYAFLLQELTAEKVREYFASICDGDVIRYELPNLWGLNFVLNNSLGLGSRSSLRTDSQGKVLGTSILQMEILQPENFKDMILIPTPKNQAKKKIIKGVHGDIQDTMSLIRIIIVKKSQTYS